MILKIVLSANNNIILPKGFNYQMQGLTYSLLDKIPADWFHNTGFKYEKRAFKHFVFFSILEKVDIIKIKRFLLFQKIFHLQYLHLFTGFWSRLPKIL